MTGKVFEDGNGDGVRDAGEVGLAGALLTLTGAASGDRVLLSDEQGSYRFDDLAPGNYALRVDAPARHFVPRSNVREVEMIANRVVVVDFPLQAFVPAYLPLLLQ